MGNFKNLKRVFFKMFIPRCTRMIGEPFIGKHKVTVFSDGCVPAAHLAPCLGVKKDTFERKLKENPTDVKHCTAETSMYRTDTHQKVRNLVTKERVARFLKEHLKWDDDTIERALDELYSKDNIYRTPRVAIPPKKKSEDELSSESDSASDDPLVKCVKKCMGTFMREIDQHVNEQAVYRYQQTSEFQACVQKKLAEAVAQKADALYPMVRKQLEERIQHEEEQAIRLQVRKRVRDEANATISP